MYDVLKYIHEHICEELSLVALADRFGYSKWHFCTKFHEYTGKTLVKYIRHYRLQLAALDLLNDGKSVDVAADYGYDSVSGFNKAFLAEFGCYPSEYKKISKESLLYCERRKCTMFSLSDRCETLRSSVLNGHEYENNYFLQHEVYVALGQNEAYEQGKTRMEIISGGMSRLLNSFTPVIQPQELIVGFNFADERPRGKPNPYLRKDDAEEILMKRNGVSDADYAKYRTLEKVPFAPLSPDYTKQEADCEKEWAAISRPSDSNHTVIGYEQVLRLGFSGLLRRVEEYEAKNGDSPLYRGAKEICRAACGMGEKYAQAAEALLQTNDLSYAKEDLEKIIRVCRRVPAYPAETLHEAVQALWFAHIINTWEDYINANSLGRLDQILYPYYKSDIEKGILTKEEAFELICCLWIKLYRSYDVQQSAVGGTSPEGEDQVNDLSYMMLDATEQLDFVRCLSVRYSQKTDKAFVKRALEVVGHVQKGVPFFFNDDVVIPALESKGISHADACDYTQIGCVETVIPGKSNPHAVVGEVNLLKALEYTFTGGCSMMYPEMKNGADTGSLAQFDTFEKFYTAVKTQMRSLIDTSCRGVKKWRSCSVANSPKPYKSLLTEGCLENNLDFNDAGALYDYYQIMLCGVPNLADSLEAIRQFVYRDHKYTLEEVFAILQADFPDEAVRREFVNKAAKFGNDIDSVDSLAVDIVNVSCDILEDMCEKYSLSFHAQPFTYLWMISHGMNCAASPDGRRKGEIIAYSVSPMQGRDFSGLTALFNSISKFPTKRTPGITSAIVEIDPRLFTDSNISVLTDVLLAASAKGLNNVQFNTVDAEMLIDAQKNPDKYSNLAVRVSGFSQKFNLISPQLQDHIIARTKHSCL